MPLELLDETQVAKINAMMTELYAGLVGGGGAGQPSSLPTTAEAFALFNEMWKINVVEIAAGKDMAPTTPPTEGRKVFDITLPRGGWLCGGQIGAYGSRADSTPPGVPAVISHLHADHNADGLEQLQTSPGKGTTQAQHLTSNNSNGWVNALPIRAYFLPIETKINVVAHCDYNSGAGATVKCYGAIWGFRFLKF